MRILVTGGAGYIGSHTTRHFLEHGHDVWVLDNLSLGHAASVPADRLVRGDLADRQLLENVLKGRSIEGVVHFAAFPYVGESVQDPEKYYNNNLVNSLNLLAAMRRCDVGRIVFSSTCATYGEPTIVPITEEQAQKPINPYGRTKLGIEWALADYASAYGLAYAALRYFNAAGASSSGDLGEDHDPETHLIPIVLQVALGQRSHVEIFGTDYPTPDGTCIRDYVHVDDLADAHRRALRLRPGRSVHLPHGPAGAAAGLHLRRREPADEGGVECLHSRENGSPAVLVHDAVEAVAAEAGLLVMKTLIEAEVEEHAGPRYRHLPGREASRWGHEEGSVVFAGRKLPLARPRLRSRDGREVPLERYERFRADGRLQRAVTPRVLAGVAMRDYEGTLDAVCDGYGVQKSSVSRHWKAVSAARLREFLERPLGDLDLAVLMLDGIEFHERQVLVALGLDSQGKKHVLGLWPGLTENATACKELLAHLVERGLATDRKYLVVIDGSNQAAIQRCQVHEERNVLEQLPPEHHGRVRQRLRAAWNLKNYVDAEAALQKLVVELEAFSPAAANSLREGLEETLTVHRLGVPEKLRRTLRSTNPIESCFSAARHRCRNVKRWHSEEMVQRWVGTMLLEVEARFRRIRGHREMPLLLAALRPRGASESSAA